jgi:hypothetical protein
MDAKSRRGTQRNDEHRSERGGTIPGSGAWKAEYTSTRHNTMWTIDMVFLNRRPGVRVSPGPPIPCDYAKKSMELPTALPRFKKPRIRCSRRSDRQNSFQTGRSDWATAYGCSNLVSEARNRLSGTCVVDRLVAEHLAFSRQKESNRLSPHQCSDEHLWHHFGTATQETWTAESQSDGRDHAARPGGLVPVAERLAPVTAARFAPRPTTEARYFPSAQTERVILISPAVPPAFRAA